MTGLSGSSELTAESAADLTADAAAGQGPSPAGWPARLPFYYGWVNVVIAALAMLGTLPGRTHGLGLITEKLLRSFAIDRNDYSHINLWATLIGSLFCLPAGRLIDRFGSRTVLVLVTLALGVTVWTMSAVTGIAALFLMVTLTRGFGQSALSVVSIAIVGKWFRRRISLATGIYSCLVTVAFLVGFAIVTSALKSTEGDAEAWRAVWRGIAIALLAGLLPLSLLLARSSPESCRIVTGGTVTGGTVTGGTVTGEMQSDETTTPTGYRLGEALQTPAFWIFALGTSLYGLAVSGISIYNQDILREIGFDADTFYSTYAYSIPAGLIGQLAGGVIAWRWSIKRLMVVAMLLYALALVWLPSVVSLTALYGCVALTGLAGGMITVTFFAVWPDVFGRAHLGRIQGVAQMLTVLASAVGPMLFSQCLQRTASYMPAFYGLATVVFALGIGAWFVPLPRVR